MIRVHDESENTDYEKVTTELRRTAKLKSPSEKMKKSCESQD